MTKNQENRKLLKGIKEMNMVLSLVVDVKFDFFV